VAPVAASASGGAPPAAAVRVDGSTSAVKDPGAGGAAAAVTVLLREVARPVSNLGNTCYMNAVLQALAHAPELCLAMDCDRHSVNCPVNLENRRHRLAAPGASLSSSPEDAASAAAACITNGNDPEHRRRPARKLRRSSRKSPTNGVSANIVNGRENNSTNSSNNNEAGTPNSSSADDEYKFCTLCELEWHLDEVHSQIDKDKPVAPSAFVEGFIDQIAPWFKLGQQEDSHEFLRLLIDAMQRSCKEARPKSNTNIVAIESENNAHVGTSIKESSASPATEDVEYPFQLFRGTVESCVTCDSCKSSSSTLDPIEDVGLEVTPSPSSPSSVAMSTRGASSTPPSNEALADVPSAFLRFARVENLDAGYKCEQCGKGGRATKQSRLASIPPILTLHLKRFRYGGDTRGPAQAAVSVGNRRTKSGSAKIEGHIEFQQFFDLKPYLTDELQAKAKSMFCRLFAVIVHSGKNSHSGHYFAFVRNVNKKEWSKMDDARVTMVTEDEVMSAEAYMLFYRVVDHPVAVSLKERHRKLLEERETMAARLAAAAVEEDHKLGTVEAEKQNDLLVLVRQESGKKSSPVAATKKAAAAALPSTPSAEKITEKVQPVAVSIAQKSSPSMSSGRKRRPPDFTDGPSWAGAKTRLKSSQYSSLRCAEGYISENVQFKHTFFKRINEEGSKPNARLDKCAIKQITGMRHFGMICLRLMLIQERW